jgi:hypothetical protein
MCNTRQAGKRRPEGLVVLIPRRTVLKRGELHDDVEVWEDETRQLKYWIAP